MVIKNKIYFNKLLTLLCVFCFLSWLLVFAFRYMVFSLSPVQDVYFVCSGDEELDKIDYAYLLAPNNLDFRFALASEYVNNCNSYNDERISKIWFDCRTINDKCQDGELEYYMFILLHTMNSPRKDTLKRAREWLKLSADKGYLPAIHLLG